MMVSKFSAVCGAIFTRMKHAFASTLFALSAATADVMAIDGISIGQPREHRGGSCDGQDRKLAELHTRIIAAEQQLSEARKSATADFDAWLDKLPEGPQLPSLDGETARFHFDTLDRNGTPNSVGGNPAKTVGTPVLVDGKEGRAVEFNGGDGFTFPGLAHFTRSDAFSFALWLRQARPTPRAVVLHRSRAHAGGGIRGYELLIEEGHVSFGLHHLPPADSLKVVTREKVSGWTHVAVTYDGSSRAGGLCIYLNGRAAKLEIIRDTLRNDITCSEHDLAIGHRSPDAGFKGGSADDFRIFTRELSALEVTVAAGLDDYTTAVQSIPTPTPAQRKALFDFYIATAHQPSLDARKALHAARDELRKLAGN